ncbi:FKBP-type peptidyl-prolyl cis-trans isomerase [Daejeonella sp. H1SJ63]|jgi:FKBP-type peptidyl-prolyl cis-trans isomerase|uniref:FKBP-type peptidyl-prolyl cis-trans isomerase n=1 Tax=Daejeonella sp. H1SJ63 TaxID=3034145 RepID=UPI0023EC522E|nr:FKBP-type peptidyl-prolyl cis-trans isomerase [Daejeonella sp. H1SJ63]
MYLSSQKYFLLIIASILVSISVNAQTRSKLFTEKPVKLNSENDSLQYTLGAYLGQWITNNGFILSDPEAFRKGMDDVLLNKTLMVDAGTVAARLDSYQKRLISERSSQQEKLLFENIKGKEGVGMLPSGVGYLIMRPGNGIRPQLNDSVLIHVKGFLPDGKSFENTYAKNTPIRATPAGLISGMSEALQIMPVGSIWRMFIPSAMAYAEKGVPGLIPAYSALVFEVELVNAVRNQ